MKLTNFIWVLALAGGLAACNSGPPITGCDPGEVIDNVDGSPTFGQCIPDEAEGSAAGIVDSACTDGADAGCNP
jgi:hypothetical protein